MRSWLNRMMRKGTTYRNVKRTGRACDIEVREKRQGREQEGDLLSASDAKGRLGEEGEGKRLIDTVHRSRLSEAL